MRNSSEEASGDDRSSSNNNNNNTTEEYHKSRAKEQSTKLGGNLEPGRIPSSSSSNQSNKCKPQDWISECEESLKDHEALCKATSNVLSELFEEDPLLGDLPADVSPEEIEAQIAVLTGQSITIYIERESFPTLKVIVPQSKTSVLDLKKAIRRAYELEQLRNSKPVSRKLNTISSGQHQRSKSSSYSNNNKKSSSSNKINNSSSSTGGVTSKQQQKSHHHQTTNISWRYIWRTYFLSNENQPLINDSQSLSSYGVVNKTILKFVKQSKIKRLQKRGIKVHKQQ